MSGNERRGSSAAPPLDFADFAQEFLRRNPLYRDDYRKQMGAKGVAAADARRAIASRWGLLEPLSPERAASEEPALWSPTVSAFTVVLAAASLAVTGIAPVRSASVLADKSLAGGRYLILGDAANRHRLWILTRSRRGPPTYIIPRDAAADLRFASARRCDRFLSGAPPTRSPGCAPTPFQRYRLGVLLDILDALQAPREAPVTTHEIARTLIYPALGVGRGAEWKSSSERRQTQRLIDEARELMEGGYRRLLMGKPAGGDKKQAPK